MIDWEINPYVLISLVGLNALLIAFSFYFLWEKETTNTSLKWSIAILVIPFLVSVYYLYNYFNSKK